MQTACGTSAAGCGAAGATLRSYAYTLGAAGNRLSVAELNGRTVNYGYDDLYRLTSETVAADPGGRNGQVTYSYDSVGNRTQLSSTLAAVPPTGLLNYDANDRTATDSYDANGNLTFNGQQNVYDFENRLVQRGGVTIVYDGDGNRVQETVAGVVTKYLTAEVNPTGYVQVVAELSNTNQIVRGYEWGLQLAAVRDFTVNSGGIFHYYGLDGHGSVRFLTDSTGAVTDTYRAVTLKNLCVAIPETFDDPQAGWGWSSSTRHISICREHSTGCCFSLLDNRGSYCNWLLPQTQATRSRQVGTAGRAERVEAERVTSRPRKATVP